MVKKQEEENNKVREEYKIMTKNLEAMKKEIAKKNSSITQLETISTRIYIQNGHLMDTYFGGKTIGEKEKEKGRRGEKEKEKEEEKREEIEEKRERKKNNTQANEKICYFWNQGHCQKKWTNVTGNTIGGRKKKRKRKSQQHKRK